MKTYNSVGLSVMPIFFCIILCLHSMGWRLSGDSTCSSRVLSAVRVFCGRMTTMSPFGLYSCSWTVQVLSSCWHPGSCKQVEDLKEPKRLLFDELSADEFESTDCVTLYTFCSTLSYSHMFIHARNAFLRQSGFRRFGLSCILYFEF